MERGRRGKWKKSDDYRREIILLINKFMKEKTEAGFAPEKESKPKDISSEFLTMDSVDFYAFLRTLREAPALAIKVDWKDIFVARKLKAFLDDPRKPREQKRFATIRATEEQHNQELNVFGSGVEWEEIE